MLLYRSRGEQKQVSSQQDCENLKREIVNLRNEEWGLARVG
jgi:hypothetical protein